MSGFQFALAIGALIAIACASHLPRAAAWVLVLAFNFVVATAWARLGLSHQHVVNLTLDAVACLAIYLAATEKWEVYLFRVLWVSVFASFAFMTGAIGFGAGIFGMPNEYTYISILELCNWAALSIIAGTGVFDRFGANVGSRDYLRGHLHSARSALRAAATAHRIERAVPK